MIESLLPLVMWGFIRFAVDDTAQNKLVFCYFHGCAMPFVIGCLSLAGCCFVVALVVVDLSVCLVSAVKQQLNFAPLKTILFSTAKQALTKTNFLPSLQEPLRFSYTSAVVVKAVEPTCCITAYCKSFLFIEIHHVFRNDHIRTFMQYTY